MSLHGHRHSKVGEGDKTICDPSEKRFHAEHGPQCEWPHPRSTGFSKIMRMISYSNALTHEPVRYMRKALLTCERIGYAWQKTMWQAHRSPNTKLCTRFFIAEGFSRIDIGYVSVIGWPLLAPLLEYYSSLFK